MGTRAVVNSYTGANVSIFIGDTLITNAFGITWELSAGKRPIFGYNGLHQQAFATGQVMVLGSLYLNFQHPNYLSYVLKKYFELKRQIKATAGAAEATATIKNSMTNLINEYKQLRPGQTLSPQTLDNLFKDKAMQAQLIPAMTAGELLNVNVTSGVTYNNFKRGLTFDRELTSEEKTEKWAAYARPDQFVGAEDTSDAIDIVVTFGNPGLKTAGGGTANYQTGSGIILRSVNFLGEGMTVMSDDQPVMEVYKFMAASKDYLAAAELTEDEIIELQQYGRANEEQRAQRDATRQRTGAMIGAKAGMSEGGGENNISVDPTRVGSPVGKLPNEDPEPGAPQIGLPAQGERGTTTTTPPASASPAPAPSTPSTAPAGTPAPPIAVERTDPVEVPPAEGDE